MTLGIGAGLVGLIGPNGAGKSTLLRILATLLEPTSEAVRWRGVDTRSDGAAIRRVLGYLPQEFGVYPQLTVWWVTGVGVRVALDGSRRCLCLPRPHGGGARLFPESLRTLDPEFCAGPGATAG